MKGLLMAVVTETKWSMTPSSSGLVTFAILKTWRTVSDRRFRQPRGSWALATSDASGGHSRLKEQIWHKSAVWHHREVTATLKAFVLLVACAIVHFLNLHKVFPCSFLLIPYILLLFFFIMNQCPLIPTLLISTIQIFFPLYAYLNLWALIR